MSETDIIILHGLTEVLSKEVMKLEKRVKNLEDLYLKEHPNESLKLNET